MNAKTFLDNKEEILKNSSFYFGEIFRNINDEAEFINYMNEIPILKEEYIAFLEYIRVDQAAMHANKSPEVYLTADYFNEFSELAEIDEKYKKPMSEEQKEALTIKDSDRDLSEIFEYLISEKGWIR